MVHGVAVMLLGRVMAYHPEDSGLIPGYDTNFGTGCHRAFGRQVKLVLFFIIHGCGPGAYNYCKTKLLRPTLKTRRTAQIFLWIYNQDMFCRKYAEDDVFTLKPVLTVNPIHRES
jgi:hypothetical protein